jgi:8-oxo-dGTP pyrophosphatase MutT (NUDIX family)
MSESEAAHREAEEEAGASGAVLPEPLTTYLYVKSNSAEQFAIRAYLLDVRDTRPPAEPWRKPAWYGRKDAKKKLAENRAPEYADELARVIELAVDQLRQ